MNFLHLINYLLVNSAIMKVNWNEEKENLKKMLDEQQSYASIARHYGVSDNSIKKAALKLGFELLPRRVINETEQNSKHRNNISSVCKKCGKHFVQPSYKSNNYFCCEQCKHDYYGELLPNFDSTVFFNKKNR